MLIVFVSISESRIDYTVNKTDTLKGWTAIRKYTVF